MNNNHVSFTQYMKLMRGEAALPHLPGPCNDCRILYNQQKHILVSRGTEYSPIWMNDTYDQNLFDEYARFTRNRNWTNSNAIASRIIQRLNHVQRALLELHNDRITDVVIDVVTWNGSKVVRTEQIEGIESAPRLITRKDVFFSQMDKQS